MSKDFFKLDEPFKTLLSEDDLQNLLLTSCCVKNILYKPDTLGDAKSKQVKIKNTTFSNVSFSFTNIVNVYFQDCTFEECLFIGTTIVDCEFHSSQFKMCNLYKVQIVRTYVNPKSFYRAIKKIEHSNIAVHLFQQLLNNSRDLNQGEFARLANFKFLDWKRKLLLNQYRSKKPKPLKFWKLAVLSFIDYIYKLGFGYGLRLRNFLLSFFLLLSTFYTINYLFWNRFDLAKKDLVIDNFNPCEFSHKANFFYTIDITTKIIDSQFQPKSNFGMVFFMIEGGLGFLFLTGLITILFNKFVKS